MVAGAVVFATGFALHTADSILLRSSIVRAEKIVGLDFFNPDVISISVMREWFVSIFKLVIILYN